MDYLMHHSGLTPDEIPVGKVVRHNPVIPSRIAGLRGSRMYFVDANDPANGEPCQCGWAPEIGPHYSAGGPMEEGIFHKVVAGEVEGCEAETDEALREMGEMCWDCDSSPGEIEVRLIDGGDEVKVCAACYRASE